jgi:serine phosphatase RsbU (regulator of sigma subunit)/anti-sigma regulatory factor (Ser/Thr protein kinase)
MFNRPIKEINAEFLAEEKYLESIQRVVREACATAGMSRKTLSAVLLAMEEASTNVIRHAYLYEKGILRLRIVIYKKLVSFSLIDTGRSFDPSGAGQLDLNHLVESGRKGGLGFYMIQKIMDRVEYISAVGFNELRMIKRLDTTTPDSHPLVGRLFSLRVRFSIWTFLIVSIIIAVAFWFVNQRTVAGVYKHLDQTVEALAKSVAEQAKGYLINRRSDVEFDELIVSYSNSNPLLKVIVLVDSSGLVLAHSEDIRNIRKPYRYPDGVDTSLIDAPQLYHAGRVELRYLVTRIQARDRRLGSVHMTYSDETYLAQLVEARNATLILTGVLLLVGIGGIYLLSNYFVRPIVKITQRVRRFSQGDMETEIPLEGADEFFEIASALNDMMTRLSRDRRHVIERERMAKEIEVASQIQKTLLPAEIPDIPTLDVHAFYRSASHVGGDLYDIFDIGSGRYAMVVADVSGKGVPASLVMSMLRTVLRIEAARFGSARETLIAVNDYLVKNTPPGMFITVMTAVYDAATRKLGVVSAGHTPMLLHSASTGAVTFLNPRGMPLGVPVSPGWSFGDGLDEATIDLHPGDSFILYTDGISEALNREGKQYGFERLRKFFQQLIQSDGSKPASALSDALVNEIDDYCGVGKQSDDITFIVARFKPQGALAIEGGFDSGSET